MRRTALLLVPLLYAACSAPTRSLRAPAAPAADRREAALELPEDWRACSAPAFERWVLGTFAGEAPRPLAPAAREELAAALRLPGESGVRAAVVLGRSRARDASEVLARRLEERCEHPERNGDAADVVAAHALAWAENAHALGPRLEALAAGERPHPDLEVRVECAASALALGHEAGVAFLLAVLRLGTPAGLRDERDFTPTDTSAWARARAARALARRAGVALSYRVDAPLEAREAAVRDLERALGR